MGLRAQALNLNASSIYLLRDLGPVTSPLWASFLMKDLKKEDKSSHFKSHFNLRLSQMICIKHLGLSVTR